MITPDLKTDIWIHEDSATKKVLLTGGNEIRTHLSLSESFLNLTSNISSYAADYFYPQGRLLLLKGEKGTVACRVNQDLSLTLPRISEDWTLEFATRTFLRMSNLVAVRGIPGASMVGPCDYFGNLGQLHKYLYNFNVTVFPPILRREMIVQEEIIPVLTKFDNTVVTTVRVNWISGTEKEIIDEKKSEYHFNSQHLCQSLFINPGLLEIDTNLIELKHFEPRGVDLSSFKARLVDNTIPFQISKKALTSKDDYRVVTYRYEKDYAEWQVQNGSGLFLEKHRFSQTITPLTEYSKGFVVLARLNENDNELEMIGIEIPFGATLIIEEDCIHGDTSLNGFFMMGMTSDHTTMQTADTVFLKDYTTKKNVQMLLSLSDSKLPVDCPLPYVIFADANDEDKVEFVKLTKDKSLIFTPFCSDYWSLLSGK